jgi:putative membrane protein
VIVGTLALAVLYLWAVGPLRRKHGWAPRFPVGRAAVFFASLLLLFFSLNGPLHDLSDYYSFSAHMVQHLLLTEVWAPLLILGLPPWLVGALVRRPAWGRAARFWSAPLLAGGIFIVSLGLWHTIPYYDLMMRNHNVHIACHLMFMVTAVMSWWCVAAPLPEAGKLKEPAAMLYLFLLGVPMQVIAAIITLSEQVLYPWYSTAPRVFGLTPLADQQLGGLLMWVPGGLALWIAITVLWVRWARHTERIERDHEAPPLTLPRSDARGPRSQEAGA